GEVYSSGANEFDQLYQFRSQMVIYSYNLHFLPDQGLVRRELHRFRFNANQYHSTALANTGDCLLDCFALADEIENDIGKFSIRCLLNGLLDVLGSSVYGLLCAKTLRLFQPPFLKVDCDNQSGLEYSCSQLNSVQAEAANPEYYHRISWFDSSPYEGVVCGWDGATHYRRLLERQLSGKF